MWGSTVQGLSTPIAYGWAARGPQPLPNTGLCQCWAAMCAVLSGKRPFRLPEMSSRSLCVLSQCLSRLFGITSRICYQKNICNISLKHKTFLYSSPFFSRLQTSATFATLDVCEALMKAVLRVMGTDSLFSTLLHTKYTFCPKYV